MESSKTKSIFEITFPSLTCGKFDFSVDIESGTFRIDKVHFIGSPKINFSLLVYGGENTVNHDFYVYNHSFSLSNSIRVLSTKTNFLGGVGDVFTIGKKTQITFILNILDKIEETSGAFMIIVDRV